MKQEDIFIKAQKYEVGWWGNHIVRELKPINRDWLVGYQSHVGRGHLARMGLNQANMFYALKPFLGKTMDLGSSIVSFFEGQDFPVVAVEPSLGMLYNQFPNLTIIGQSRNVRYFNGVIQDVQEEDFENVWCCNMLDHTPDWADILTVQIPRVLKPGGKLYLSVDCRRANVKLDDGHLTAFSPSMLHRHLDPLFKKIWASTPPDDKINYYRWDYIGALK